MRRDARRPPAAGAVLRITAMGEQMSVGRQRSRGGDAMSETKDACTDCPMAEHAARGLVQDGGLARRAFLRDAAAAVVGVWVALGATGSEARAMPLRVGTAL